MSKTLGIYVSSDKHIDKLINLCRAANKKNVEVKVFFTASGTQMCTDPQLKELLDLAQIAVCKVGFEANQLQRPDTVLEEKAFSNQSWHAEMIYDCDRYIAF